MAIIVTPNLSPISLCNESTTSWSSDNGGTTASNGDVPVEGTYCVQNYASNNTTRGARLDFGGAGGIDMRNQIIYIWFSVSKIDNIPPYGAQGMRLRLVDTSSNWSEWDLFGGDTLPHGGWQPWAIGLAVSPSRSSATPANLQYVRYVGWRCGDTTNVTAKTYIYWDAVRYGTGLKITGGTSGTPATWEDFYSADNVTNKYGVITKDQGIYYIQGEIVIGDASQSAITYFKDTGKIIVFRNSIVTSTRYKIQAVGNGTYKTSFVLGSKSGTVGVGGGTIFSANSSKPVSLDFDDTNLDDFGLYGVNVISGGTTTFPTAAANHEVLNTTFNTCGLITASTCVIKNCNIIGCTGRALQLPGTTHNLSDSVFIDNVYAIYANFDSEDPDLSLSNVKFYGSNGSSKYDLDHGGSGGNLDVSCTDTSNMNDSYVYESGGGSTDVINNVNLIIDCENSSGSYLVGIKCGIYKQSDNTELMNEDTVETLVGGSYKGRAVQPFNYPGSDVPVYVKIRRSSDGSTRYRPISTTGTITSTGFSLTAVLEVDEVAS